MAAPISCFRISETDGMTPSKRGISIRSGARKNILNVYSRLREENPQKSISGILRKVSELTGVSKRTVFRLKKEKKTLSVLSSPGKKRPGAVGQHRRLRFVEWAQNEIAVVPDFHKRILFSDEAPFWLNSYVNKQNCRIWSEVNPQVYVETPLHQEKLTVWSALWAGGILLQNR
ncbi:uncharacterized protein TNCV_4788531 [Trichonephila clavipes]|nr:uncharacterized protein TNCV_4788531 [Trichonephila clavipes]